MLEESEARKQVLERIETGPVIWLPIDLARDHFAAQDLHGVSDFPDFDNSSMDGYAVRASEAMTGASLKVVDKIQPAGIDQHLKLPVGHAIRIFTGAPIPEGADAVIMQEDVDRTDQVILVQEAVVTGENIRRRGGDVCAGQKIIAQGDRLTPARLSLLASQGIDEVPIYTRPMIHVVTTGDELVQIGDYRMPGQIYDSNGILLKTSIEALGGIAEQVHLQDDPELMRQAIAILCEVSDFVVIAGGVSVGERDFVKDVLNALGVETSFWRVRIKPGKPFLYGQHPNGCSIFGLPGNPVSAFVTFQIFVAPALRKRLGQIVKDPGLLQVIGRAGEVLRNGGDRPHYLRAVETDGEVFLSGTQQSHAIFGLSKANCLIRLEPGQKVEEGDMVSGIKL
ncbi:MAG: molybdopterin molybdotransferase MoeA [Verrucomicrobiales bacterium]|nr:molybdopterin molybdotransferase MoeA [Verrucomicrobiales bacterium]